MIIVCPLARVPDIAREHKPSRIVGLLDPGTAFPIVDGFADAHRLRLSLHDIEQDAEGLSPCADTHMREIVDFVSGWDRAAPILIHCYAGISRSTATAFITACAHNPDADEHVIARTLRDASSTASPNRRFVALADEMLQRKGRMSRAIDAIGRGPPWHEVGEATPFTIASRYS